jgi:hypothetical protein
VDAQALSDFVDERRVAVDATRGAFDVGYDVSFESAQGSLVPARSGPRQEQIRQVLCPRALSAARSGVLDESARLDPYFPKRTACLGNRRLPRRLTRFRGRIHGAEF